MHFTILLVAIHQLPRLWDRSWRLVKPQPNEPCNVYEFTSLNGVKLTILDTPGLVDTRGFEQDKQHKASIATTIKNTYTRLSSLLMAHNPASALQQTMYFRLYLQSFLADNIGIVFTNVSSPDDWNFDQNSLPDVLRARYENQWLLDNPMEMLRKRHQAALEEICSLLIFDWLDDHDPQPTKLEAVRNNKADAQTIKMIEDSLETMKKLEVMERANAK
ncbi:hypothetical protein F5887DRAFT_1167471 [Amanita rubescens]|nr:hypothetical protein F5887DRAFT_1167471 [Amanita rubescens]